MPGLLVYTKLLNEERRKEETSHARHHSVHILTNLRAVGVQVFTDEVHVNTATLTLQEPHHEPVLQLAKAGERICLAAVVPNSTAVIDH